MPVLRIEMQFGCVQVLSHTHVLMLFLMYLANFNFLFGFGFHKSERFKLNWNLPDKRRSLNLFVLNLNGNKDGNK